MKPNIRLIAADFDGTLLSPDSSISPYNLQMIQRVQASGLVFAAATGRFAENASQMMLDNGVVCPIISANGAVVDLAPYGERIHEITMEKETARAVFERLEALGIGYYIFGPGTVDTRRVDGRRHISEADQEHLNKLKKRVKYAYGEDACRAALARPIYKFFAFFSTDIDDIQQIGQGFYDHIPGIEVSQSGRHNLEIMSDRANKGIGLAALARRLGIPREQTMALGDHNNDLSMLRWAGLGVAMGNAGEDIKRQADAVTASNSEDGVGHAIARYCFGET
jgi:Cof subfamily protein (haloacid dehalogenase superfamily)